MHVFFFNDTATTEIYTLSLHDALPIYMRRQELSRERAVWRISVNRGGRFSRTSSCPISRMDGTSPQIFSMKLRSEEHTSELQSRQYLVCRLLLEKKKNSMTVTRRFSWK